eukprot:1181525-Prorocentrum_minimum.AAC.2
MTVKQKGRNVTHDGRSQRVRCTSWSGVLPEVVKVKWSGVHHGQECYPRWSKSNGPVYNTVSQSPTGDNMGAPCHARGRGSGGRDTLMSRAWPREQRMRYTYVTRAAAGAADVIRFFLRAAAKRRMSCGCHAHVTRVAPAGAEGRGGGGGGATAGG